MDYKYAVYVKRADGLWHLLMVSNQPFESCYNNYEAGYVTLSK